jgi:hypothetical protein
MSCDVIVFLKKKLQQISSFMSKRKKANLKCDNKQNSNFYFVTFYTFIHKRRACDQEHKWWVKVKFMCHENTAQWKEPESVFNFNLCFIVHFRFAICFVVCLSLSLSWTSTSKIYFPFLFQTLFVFFFFFDASQWSSYSRFVIYIFFVCCENFSCSVCFIDSRRIMSWESWISLLPKSLLLYYFGNRL